MLVVSNFTPVAREGYRIGVPEAGQWDEVLNSDAEIYGGSNTGNMGGAGSDAAPAHGCAQSIEITVPPLATVFFRHTGG